MGASQPAQPQTSGTLFDGMNLGSQQPQQNTGFGAAPQQQQTGMGLFDGLDQQQNNSTTAISAPQQPAAQAKPTMWDGNSKLFDLSANSLKPAQPTAQPAPQLLQTDPNSPGLSGDPFGAALATQQPQAPQPASGFKPGIDTSMMMNQLNMGNQQMQMNQMGQM